MGKMREHFRYRKAVGRGLPFGIFDRHVAHLRRIAGVASNRSRQSNSNSCVMRFILRCSLPVYMQRIAGEPAGGRMAQGRDTARCILGLVRRRLGTRWRATSIIFSLPGICRNALVSVTPARRLQGNTTQASASNAAMIMSSVISPGV
jgi:hypothetical protein